MPLRIPRGGEVVAYRIADLHRRVRTNRLALLLDAEVDEEDRLEFHAEVLAVRQPVAIRGKGGIADFRNCGVIQPPQASRVGVHPPKFHAAGGHHEVGMPGRHHQVLHSSGR